MENKWWKHVFSIKEVVMCLCSRHRVEVFSLVWRLWPSSVPVHRLRSCRLSPSWLFVSLLQQAVLVWNSDAEYTFKKTYCVQTSYVLWPTQRHSLKMTEHGLDSWLVFVVFSADVPDLSFSFHWYSRRPQWQTRVIHHHSKWQNWQPSRALNACSADTRLSHLSFFI